MDNDNIKDEGTPKLHPNPEDVIGAHKKLWRKRKNLNVLFTGLICLVTSIYTVFSFLQWEAMKDTLKDADTSNKYTRESIDFAKKSSSASDSFNNKSLTIANGALEATRASNALAEKSSHQELRAYISLTDISPLYIHPNQLFDVSFRFTKICGHCGNTC
jgi:hypothetical protein